MVLFINLLGEGLTQEVNGDGGSIWWAPAKTDSGWARDLGPLLGWDPVDLFSLSTVSQLLRASTRLFVDVVALVVTFSSSTVSQLLRTEKRLFVDKVVPWSTSQEGRSSVCKSSLLVSWIKCLFPLSISLFRSRRAVTKLLFSSRINCASHFRDS